MFLIYTYSPISGFFTPGFLQQEALRNPQLAYLQRHLKYPLLTPSHSSPAGDGVLPRIGGDMGKRRLTFGVPQSHVRI